ncbi:hypothetical protein [Candidatus Nitrosocosmicus arcticus]|uniref:Uncharacterized protein n=1 Tax=Candidatus Nitrosocosmicus arcticus TaxID=2035267 RepID=A0A557SUC0_9ARCH|nr:hypothetical protein [Candidatus Nitrosocosmicus arcticus]TVP40193.1 hypothetical protein NARC_90099 [Candidatus Nitrosocosmicus arcticus]
MYSLVKYVYKDDGKVDSFGFTINKENLKILKAMIDVVLIADDKSDNNKKVKTPLAYRISMFSP